MQPLVRSSLTGYWIPACAGLTDNSLNPATTLPVVFVGECVTSVIKHQSQMATNTVIPAKAGIQYADGGTESSACSTLLKAACQCNRWFAVHKTGYWISACAGMTSTSPDQPSASSLPLSPSLPSAARCATAASTGCARWRPAGSSSFGCCGTRALGAASWR